MDRQPFLHDFQQRLLEMFRASPAADLERNLKALVNQSFNKLELVTREEFDIQIDLMRELAARVEALEIAALRGDGERAPGSGDTAARGTAMGAGPGTATGPGPATGVGTGREAPGSRAETGRDQGEGRGSAERHGEIYPGVGGSPPAGRS